MLFPTHLIFGLATGFALRFPIKTAVIAGVIADADVIFYLTNPAFPFIHRGIFHTPIILGIILIGIYLATKRQDITLAFAAGFLGHLFLDTLNPTGIMWLYPLPVFFSLNLVSYADPLANSAIMLLSLAVVAAAWKGWTEKFTSRLRKIKII